MGKSFHQAGHISALFPVFLDFAYLWVPQGGGGANIYRCDRVIQYLVNSAWLGYLTMVPIIIWLILLHFDTYQ